MRKYNDEHRRFMRRTFMLIAFIIILMIMAVALFAYTALKKTIDSEVSMKNNNIFMTECLSNDNKNVPVKSMKDLLGKEFMKYVSNDTVKLCLNQRRARSEAEYNQAINYYPPEADTKM